jgi:hypothetical protein
MTSVRELGQLLAAETGLTKADVDNRLLILTRAGVLPRSQRGRGASTPLEDGHIADVLLSLLSPEAKESAEWAARLGALIFVDPTNGETSILRDFIISMLGAAYDNEQLSLFRVRRMLSRCHPEKPYVDIDLAIKRQQTMRMVYAEQPDLDTEDTLIDRSVVISGRIFPLLAEFLWGADDQG